jgi:hypothetical protein
VRAIRGPILSCFEGCQSASSIGKVSVILTQTQRLDVAGHNKSGTDGRRR